MELSLSAIWVAIHTIYISYWLLVYGLWLVVQA